MNKKIIIAGGSGFLGSALTDFFQKKGDQVLILTRHPKRTNELYWDGKNEGAWSILLNNCNTLINLAGKSVDCRYHTRNKKAILSSRIDSTNILNQAVAQCPNPPKVWLNASSATTYIHAESIKMTEKEGIIGDDFSMGACKRWEAAFFSKSISSVRKVAMRTSIILGDNGGALPKLKMIARLGFGGKQGRGNQMVSYISIQNFCRAVDFIIQNQDLSGAINITSPSPIPNADFMKNLRQRLHIPFGINIGQPLLEMGAWLTGTETELLLKSRNVYPQRLLNAGFVFKED